MQLGSIRPGGRGPRGRGNGAGRGLQPVASGIGIAFGGPEGTTWGKGGKKDDHVCR